MDTLTDPIGLGDGTGSVALGPLFRALHAAGRDDLVHQMVTNPTGPSYASIVNQGATTLWENLTGSGGSKDDQFLGDVGAWLVQVLVGIDQAPGSIEYKQFLIRPAIVGGMTHAAGSYATPAGTTEVSWAVGLGPAHTTSTATDHDSPERASHRADARSCRTASTEV